MIGNIDCPDCVGGTVSWLDDDDYTVWDICPKCDGSGSIPAQPTVYVVYVDYGYEGCEDKSFWLSEDEAKADAARLNGPEHDSCTDEPGDCCCRYKVSKHEIGVPGKPPGRG